MSGKLSQSFRIALIHYLKNPDKAENKQHLVTAAFAIYEDAVITCGLEPDKYLLHIDAIVRPAIDGIAIHPQVGEALDSFNRELSWSDLKHENQVFHVLTLTYHEYLKKNLINVKEIVREKLEIIHTAIQELEIDKNPYVKELKCTYVELSTLVDNYFKSSEPMPFNNFEQKLQDLCFQHKKAIESSMQIKSAYYGFLAIVCLVFFRSVFFNRLQRASHFFQKASLIPQNVLSNFTIPSVEISKPHQTLKAY